MSSAATRLAGGQFYGQVASRREARGVVLSELVHQAPRALPRHVHERTYLSLLLGGTYGEEIGRREVRHGRLSLGLRPAGVEHKDWIGRGGGRFFMVELAAERRCALRDPASLNETDALGAMLGLYREFREWDVCSPAVVDELTEVLMNCAGQRRRGEREPPSWLRRAAESVYDRRGRTVPLGDLARDAGVHSAHLSRTFRRHYGRSPAELARQLRVRRACEGLAVADRPLAEIALDAGFADQAHMTRSLTRSVGMTPGRLRRLLHRDPAT